MAIRCFGELSCPKEFIDIVKKFSLLSILETRLDRPGASRTLAYIVTTAGLCGSSDWLEANSRKKLAQSLLCQVHRVEPPVRLSLAKSLVYLCDQVKNELFFYAIQHIINYLISVLHRSWSYSDAKLSNRNAVVKSKRLEQLRSTHFGWNHVRKGIFNVLFITLCQ